MLPFHRQMTALRERLAEPLPGPAAQRAMAPSARADPTLAEVSKQSCQEAGVLALLFPVGDQPTLVLTVRRDHLPDHPGQISFPGGAREDGETRHAAALRETREEIGLPPDDIDVLGALTPLYIPPSGFCVYPFVGALPYAPALRPTDAEVADILRVPVAHLLAPETTRRATWTLRGEPVEVPFYAVDEHEVWGATAMMLAELLALVA